MPAQALNILPRPAMAGEFVPERLLPDRAVSRLHLLFPDPWPRARHYRRQRVQAESLTSVILKSMD